jgi:hypothetical protein
MLNLSTSNLLIRDCRKLKMAIAYKEAALKNTIEKLKRSK